MEHRERESGEEVGRERGEGEGWKKKKKIVSFDILNLRINFQLPINYNSYI